MLFAVSKQQLHFFFLNHEQQLHVQSNVHKLHILRSLQHNDIFSRKTSFLFFVVELAALRYNIIESRDDDQYHDRPIQTGFRKQIIDLCIDKNGYTSFKDCLSKVPLLVLRAPCL